MNLTVRKIIIPNPDNSEIPNHKYQIPNIYLIFKTNVSVIGYCNLKFVCNLVLGI